MDNQINNYGKMVIIGAIALAALVGGIIYLVKRRKKAAEQKEEN